MTRASLCQAIGTALLLSVAVCGFALSFAINALVRPPNAEAHALRKRLLADAGVREWQLQSATDSQEEVAP